MSAQNAGRITVNTGTFTEDTCTLDYDLIRNSSKVPQIRTMLEYANRRALSTLLVSGVVTPYGIDDRKPTNIKPATGKGIGNNAYQFDVMGRIEKAAVIRSQVGATAADGTFQLLMNDKHLVPGMVCMFYGGFQARVMANPTGNSAAGYLYTFKGMAASVSFVFATHTQPSGTKTCFGAYTTYSEKSLRGYGRSKFPDRFTNYMTLQRKTVAISGGAASSVLWYNYTNDGGKMSKGWMYQELAQAQAQFVMENERAKWFGVSTMKSSTGGLLANANIIDDETGLPVITGDGWEEQVAGGNVLYGSGVNGLPTADDFKDMMKMLEKQSDKVMGMNWVCVTGTDGFAHFQSIAQDIGATQNTTYFSNVEKDGQAGGAIMSAGYTFMKINFAGNSMTVLKHTLFDDEALFTERDANGNVLQSSTYFIMNVGDGANKNMEILCKEANGINRNEVTAKFNGLTGATEMSLTEEDAMKYAMLKEDLLVIYNTMECGIIYPNS